MLDPGASGAFNASNGATVAMNCGIEVKSTSASGGVIIGSAAVTATAIDGIFQISGGGSSSPAPSGVASTVADPYASIPAPPVAPSCDAAHTNYSPGYGTWTLSPGTYCGGISITNGATATFNPGISPLAFLMLTNTGCSSTGKRTSSSVVNRATVLLLLTCGVHRFGSSDNGLTFATNRGISEIFNRSLSLTRFIARGAWLPAPCIAVFYFRRLATQIRNGYPHGVAVDLGAIRASVEIRTLSESALTPERKGLLNNNMYKQTGRGQQRQVRGNSV